MALHVCGGRARRRAPLALALALTVTAAVAVAVAVGDDAFEETLLLRPLPDGQVLAHFAFTTVTSATPSPHLRLFPKSVAQLVRQLDVAEMRVCLTQGRWRADAWAAPPQPAPPGAELYAHFNVDGAATASSEVRQRWQALQQALGGMFCASLHQIGAVHSASPEWSLQRAGSRPTKLVYGSLPREAVCTENTTPFLKLLPCQRKAGLSRLLHHLTLHDASFHSMGLHINTTCSDENCTGPMQLSVRQTLSVVLCPECLTAHRDWSLSGLFGGADASACVLSSLSQVSLELHPWIVASLPSGGLTAALFSATPPQQLHSDAIPGLQFSSAPASVVQTRNMDGIVASVSVLFDLKSIGASLSLLFDPPLFDPRVLDAYRPHLHIQRFVSGRGLQLGGTVVSFVNSHATEPQRLIYFETLPWYFRIYFHTLQTNVYSLSEDAGASGNATTRLRFLPATLRSAPSEIEFETVIPPQSTVSLEYEFDKSFLRITDYPPDVARGFDVAAGVATVLDHRNPGEVLYRMYSETLLVVLPGPDMSMPFNVIAFTSTLVAFFFGTMFNVLFRQPDELAERSGNLLRLIRWIKAKWHQRKGAATVDAAAYDAATKQTKSE